MERKQYKKMYRDKHRGQRKIQWEEHKEGDRNTEVEKQAFKMLLNPAQQNQIHHNQRLVLFLINKTAICTA